MDGRKLIPMLATAAIVSLGGCATDDAVKKDADRAAPKVKKAANDAGKEAEKGADAVDDNDSK